VALRFPNSSVFGLVSSAFVAACTGPSLHVHNPDEHRVFIDGVALAATSQAEPNQLELFDGEGIDAPALPVQPVEPDMPLASRSLPFRYYGATRWDALPRDLGDNADFNHRPTSRIVQLPAPVSPWLFPLDLPLEILSWVVSGPTQHTTTVAVDITPPEQRVGETAPVDLGSFADRARAARSQR
jgi:hypothetical protein